MPNDDPPVSVAYSLASPSCSLLLFTHTLGCSRRFVSVVFEPRSLSVVCGKEKATTTIITTETTTRTSVLNYARFYIKWSFIFFSSSMFSSSVFFFIFTLPPLWHWHTHSWYLFLLRDSCYAVFFLFPRLCECAPFLFSVPCSLFGVRSVVCLLSLIVYCCPSVTCGWKNKL